MESHLDTDGSHRKGWQRVQVCCIDTNGNTLHEEYFVGTMD
jgi:hypothetical protein